MTAVENRLNEYWDLSSTSVESILTIRAFDMLSAETEENSVCASSPSKWTNEKQIDAPINMLITSFIDFQTHNLHETCIVYDKKILIVI